MILGCLGHLHRLSGLVLPEKRKNLSLADYPAQIIRYWSEGVTNPSKRSKWRVKKNANYLISWSSITSGITSFTLVSLCKSKNGNHVTKWNCLIQHCNDREQLSMQLKQSLFSAPNNKIFFSTKILLPSGHDSGRLDFCVPFPTRQRGSQIEPVVEVVMDKKILTAPFLTLAPAGPGGPRGPDMPWDPWEKKNIVLLTIQSAQQVQFYTNFNICTKRVFQYCSLL